MHALERVAVTGMGLACPVGNDLQQAWDALVARRSGVQAMPAWAQHEGLHSLVAAPVMDLDLKSAIPRKFRRTMGRVAQLAVYATGQAVADARLDDATIRSGRLGVAVGSTTGSTAATLDYYANILGPGIRANGGTAFLQVMSHTCAANVALAFGVTGRVWGPSSACASGSQSIGLAYDTIRAGLQDVMICGGAEEVHYTAAATFDLVGAASTGFNQTPTQTPRPFDRRRDGMVVGEGAGILVLERWDHAMSRGARIHAELIGFSTTCDAEHLTSPAAEGMATCMRRALAEADLRPTDIQYINAHATGTQLGDPTEAKATADVFGDRVPVSSTKGYIGHTLGGCGGIESIFVILMQQHGLLIPNQNLQEIDPDCQGPWLLQEPLPRQVDVAMSNNFAFGGINTSLVFRTAS